MTTTSETLDINTQPTVSSLQGGTEHFTVPQEGSGGLHPGGYFPISFLSQYPFIHRELETEYTHTYIRKPSRPGEGTDWGLGRGC